MTLNDEQLEKVQELSSALLPPAEIAILLELPADDRELFVDMCRNHQYSDVYAAYHRGRLQTKYELRKTVIKLAKAGSSAAGPLVDGYIKEQITKE